MNLLNSTILALTCRKYPIHLFPPLYSQLSLSFSLTLSLFHVFNLFFVIKGLNVEAALTMLVRAKSRNHFLSSLEVHEVVLDYNFSELRVQTDVDNAFSLLTAAHNVSTYRISGLFICMYVSTYICTHTFVFSKDH